MAELFIGGLTIVIGLIAAGTGLTMAANRLQFARRAFRRTTALYASAPESWNAWYLGGFTQLSMGTRWLEAGAVWLAWTLAGLVLIGLGLRLLSYV